METLKHDIEIKRGTDFSLLLRLEQDNGSPFDLTGATALARLRESLTAPSTVDFTVTIPTPINGELNVKLAAASTGSLTTGKWIWDLILTLTDGTIWSPLEGVAIVRGGASYG
ncbi:MAG: hypothetical protein AAFX78_02035 [Cyanobacteria bacterium J06638_20]